MTLSLFTGKSLMNLPARAPDRGDAALNPFESPERAAAELIELRPAALKRIVEREVIDKVDHKNFNLEVDFMRGVIPTTENIVVAIWRVLEPAIAPARLSRLVLWETPNNYVEYDGA